MTVLRRYLIASSLALSLGAASTAQASPFGVRLGITDDPDTIFGGFVWEIPITGGRSGAFVVEPGLDVGIGVDNNVDFTIAGTAHFKYLIPVGGRGSFAYPLFGPMLYYHNRDNCGRNDDCDDLDIGVNIGGGFRFDRYEIDLWFGIDDDDVPDIAFTFVFRL